VLDFAESEFNMANDEREPDPSPGDPKDDEFASVRPAPRPRSPVLAIAVIALGGLLIYHLRADLRYALHGRTPRELGDARAVAVNTLEDNSFVALRGQPDRRNSLAIEPRGARNRDHFFRLLGTSTHLLVRAADTARRADLDDRWIGRLRRFDTLPYAPSLRSYYADKVEAARFLGDDAITQLRAGRLDVRDRAGEPIALTATTPVALDLRDADQLRVAVPKDRFPTLDDARHEVEHLGIQVVSGEATADEFELVIVAPLKDRNALIAKLDEKELPFAISESRLTVLAGEFAKQPKLEWSHVQAASVVEPIKIADDAFVLVEGEAPGGFWWAPLLAAALLAFMAFNLWYLVRARRAQS
jgi:hypothetical protein